MDWPVGRFPAVSSGWLGKADLTEYVPGVGISTCQRKGSDGCAQFAAARCSVDFERATLDSSPPLAAQSLPPCHSKAALPLRRPWYGKKVYHLELQDSVTTQCKCMDSISTDVDYQAEKGPLECRCCLEDFPEPDAGSQQAESSNFSSELFAKFLRHLELAELEVAARLSFLCNLAYMIEEIEPFDMLGQHRLTFVTSSLHLKLGASRSPVGSVAQDRLQGAVHDNSILPDGDLRKLAARLTSERVQVLASMATHFWKNDSTKLENSGDQVHYRDDPTITLVSQGLNVSSWDQEACQSVSGPHFKAIDMASLIATSSSAAVPFSEGRVETLESDITLMHQNCPCDWFICDDEGSHTRTFVIQGSESFASWQTNLLFEPVQFEDPSLHVYVHRGIYEAAKGMYEQLIPYVSDYLHNTHETVNPCIRFTGHSLGGSLATLVTLMLHIREGVPQSSILPVVTFGSPAIMCGGECLLHKLGLPQNHIQCIIMHRDIVPRSLSCNFPPHVTEILRAISGTFRSHPCLAESQLYSPIGQFMILQPDDRQSPNHPFLPGGSGLYVMAPPGVGTCCDAALRSAQRAFLNSPHPLEILSDPGAYGSEGTIVRDHDPNGYTRAINHVLRREHKRLRRRLREVRRKLWSPLVCKDAPPKEDRRPVLPYTKLGPGRWRMDNRNNVKRHYNVEGGHDVRRSLSGKTSEHVQAEVFKSERICLSLLSLVLVRLGYVLCVPAQLSLVEGLGDLCSRGQDGEFSGNDY